MLKGFVENEDKPYNLMMILGRNIEAGVEMPPEMILGIVEIIEKKIRWTPIEEFFQLFPPIKRYADDGMWDYKSTKNMIEKDFGETFGKDDFKKLLMTKCYENRYVTRIGIAWVTSISDIKRRVTGTSVMESFFGEKGLPTSTT